MLRNFRPPVPLPRWRAVSKLLSGKVVTTPRKQRQLAASSLPQNHIIFCETRLLEIFSGLLWSFHQPQIVCDFTVPMKKKLSPQHLYLCDWLPISINYSFLLASFHLCTNYNVLKCSIKVNKIAPAFKEFKIIETLSDGNLSPNSCYPDRGRQSSQHFFLDITRFELFGPSLLSIAGFNMPC